jgi:outer membrane protein assembly factor BamB
MVIVTDSGKVYALDETDGVQIWNTSYSIVGSLNDPAYADGIIFVSTNGGYLYSFNATNGNYITEYSVSPDTIYTSPAVVNGIVYFGTYDGYIYALTASTLSYLWSFDVGSPIYSSPTVYQNWLCFGCNDDKIYAMNITGTAPSIKWEFTTNGSITSTAAYGDGLIFVGTSYTDHSLLALNATSSNVRGQLIWKYVLTNSYAIDTSPAFTMIGSTPFVFFTSSESDIAYALYANVAPGIYQENNPAIRAWSKTVGSSPSNPTVAGGEVFLGCENALYAFNATTGLTNWTHTFTEAPNEPIVADGRIFVTNYYGLTSFGLQYPPQTYYYTIPYSHQKFVIKLVINATPGQQINNQSLLTKDELSYTLQGISGNVGVSNITIPRRLLNASSPSGWNVMVDGISPLSGPIVVSNGTYTSLYFTYLQGTSDSVVITGTSAVPEFPVAIIAPLLVAIS